MLISEYPLLFFITRLTISPDSGSVYSLRESLELVTIQTYLHVADTPQLRITK